MPKLRYSVAVDSDSGISVDVEVPGYSREDISVEIKPYVSEIFGLPIEVKGLHILANNDKRGKVEGIIEIENPSRFNIAEVSAETINGLLTIKLPYSKKYTSVTIPVM
ncbi:MAG: Hsp20/alpha crystallin family protein [Ignavibacteria bacterium]|jgi:HSP20 family molecular chaperone IbpA